MLLSGRSGYFSELLCVGVNTCPTALGLVYPFLFLVQEYGMFGSNLVCAGLQVAMWFGGTVSCVFATLLGTDRVMFYRFNSSYAALTKKSMIAGCLAVCILVGTLVGHNNPLKHCFE